MSDIIFVDYDPQKILDDAVKAIEAALGVNLYPGDERRIYLEQLLPIIVGLKSDINESAKQNLLRYATGEKLDALGEFWNVTRLAAQKAETVMKFTLSTAMPSSVRIPAGARVTPDGTLYFATVADLTIAPGDLSGEILARSTEGGQKYNGFAAEKITTMVDPAGFVLTAKNITVSAGGTNEEEDDRYRERIRLAPESISTAGPRGAYEFWAKTASPDISAVSVTSPEPGEVVISVLLQDGAMPDEQLLERVSAVLNDERRRPLTDHVTVRAPNQVEYAIEFEYYISLDNQTSESIIRLAVDAAVTEYIDWQRSQLGRAINPDYLRKLVLEAGAYRIEMIAPEYTAIAQTEVAVLAGKTVTYGGLV